MYMMYSISVPLATRHSSRARPGPGTRPAPHRGARARMRGARSAPLAASERGWTASGARRRLRPGARPTLPRAGPRGVPQIRAREELTSSDGGGWGVVRRKRPPRAVRAAGRGAARGALLPRSASRAECHSRSGSLNLEPDWSLKPRLVTRLIGIQCPIPSFAPSVTEVLWHNDCVTELHTFSARESIFSARRRSHVSQSATRRLLLCRVSCLISRVSCLVSRVSCLAPRVSCLVSRVSCLVSRVSCLVSRVSCLVSRVADSCCPPPTVTCHVGF